MAKRKFTDQDYELLCRKLHRLEKEVQRDKKVKRRQRILSISSSSSSTEDAGQSQTEDCAEPQGSSPGAQAQDHLQTIDLEQNLAPNDAVIVMPPPNEAASAGSAPVASEADLADCTPELDADILEILGVDPTKSENFGKDIQKDVAVRFEHSATSGLSKEDRKELMSKYLIPKNCKLIGAPALNPEVKAAVSEAVVKRDTVIESKQKLTASAIASLGEAITLLLSSKDKNPDLLRLLIDTGRTLSDCQHNDTVTRRNYIIYSVKKEIKESLQNAKVDGFLFGKDLPDTLKAAKAITKSGAEFKPTPAYIPKPSTSKTNLPSTSKNWRNYNPIRPAAAATSKAKETTPRMPAASRGQRGSYSRRSQSQRVSHSRR